MVTAILDTCILIDHLNGVLDARDELARHEAAAISVITWMEVMAGAPEGMAEATREFLDSFPCIGLDGAIADAAVQIRRRSRLKLPDAIILATAEVTGAILVTRNTRDFGDGGGQVRVPYRI